MGCITTSLVLLTVKYKCRNLQGFFFLTLMWNLLIAIDAVDVAKEDIGPLPFPDTVEKISGL